MIRKVKQTLVITLSVSALCVPGLLKIPAVSAAEITRAQSSAANSVSAKSSTIDAPEAAGFDTAPDSSDSMDSDVGEKSQGAATEMTGTDAAALTDPSVPVSAADFTESSSQELLSESAETDDTAMVMSSVDTAPASSATPTPTPGPIHQAVPTPLIFVDSETYENATEGDAPSDEAQAGSSVTEPSGGNTYYYPGSVSDTYSGDVSANSSDRSGATSAVKTGEDSKSGKTHAVKTGAVKTADTSRIFPEAVSLGFSSVCLAVLLRRRKHRNQFQN